MPVLADIFSAGNVAKRRIKDFAANPMLYLDQIGGQAAQSSTERAELEKKAFGDPKAPTKITDRDAFNQYVERYGEDALNFANFGITKVAGKTIRELLYGDKPNLTSVEKARITRFEKEIQNPTAFEREVMRATGKTQIQPTPEMVMINEIGKHPSYLVDKIIVPVSSDLSASGGAVSQIAGVPLRQNVMRQGGFHYMLQKPNIDEQVAFASEPSAASSKLANLNMYKDKDVIGVSLGMSPSGTNFSHHVAQGMVRQLGALNPRPEAIQKLNAEIQNYAVKNQETKKVTYPFKDFAGVDSPNIEEQMKGNGELRKAIVEVMSKADYRKEGFPRYEDTLEAMNNPEFRQGEAGRAMFSAIPGRGLVDPTFQHESYSKGIPGIYQGGLLNAQGQVVGAPVQLLMPKTYEGMTKAGKTPHGIARSMQVAHHGEKFTEEALDPLMRFLGYQ
jgi:hypothetical protein